MIALAASAAPAFLERLLPAPLLAEGPLGLAWWQWLALPVTLALAIAGGLLLGAATRALLGRLSSRTETTWDDVLLERLRGPIAAFWVLAAAWVARGLLGLPEGWAAEVAGVLRSGFTLVLFWAAVRSLDSAFAAITASPWGRAHATGSAMLPSLRKGSKVAVVVLGAVALLGQWGVPVASLVAGLGIGGLAVALAAQKTVENLIGSLSIGVDVPFKMGDYIRVDGLEGNVEAIGLRSTRVRTLDRTLVTIPNGKLADARIETFGARDRIRLYCTLSLVYGTTAAQLRAVLEGVEAAIRGHPLAWQEEVRVRFVALGHHALEVEVMAWLQTSDWLRFQAARQELLLRFLEVVERSGTAFAFPTQTVHLAGPEAPRAARVT